MLVRVLKQKKVVSGAQTQERRSGRVGLDRFLAYPTSSIVSWGTSRAAAVTSTTEQDDLDHLAHLWSWASFSYELANKKGNKKYSFVKGLCRW